MNTHLENCNHSPHFITILIPHKSPLQKHGALKTEITMIQIQKHTKQDKSKSQSQEFTPNRYSVLYTLKGQYQHVGCSSEEEAQYVLGTLMTDGNRIPIGIYDSKTDIFEWEIIGQYFHSQDLMSNPEERLQEALTVSKALRRRDSSWQPGVMERASFFA